MADNIQATPRNYLGGLLSDAYKWMQSPERTQQMQGFAGLLGTTGVPQTIERMAYGEPLTNIGRANVPLLKPETADAMMTVAPMVGPAARGAKILPKNLPVGMSVKPVDDVVGLLTPKIDEITGLPLNADGTVTLFHHTNKSAAEQIAKTGRLKSAGEPSVYLTTQKATDTGYGDVAVPVRVKPSLLNLDDEFPSGRMDFSIDTGKPKGSIPVTVEKPSFTYPQEEALRLAQQRAALPIEQGGLGLAADNTAAQREAAMFPLKTYRGTTGDIESSVIPSDFFGSNYFGKGINLTTSPKDASKYASTDVEINHDLVGKAELMSQKLGISYPEAKAQLTSGGGTVMPISANINNPLVVGAQKIQAPDSMIRYAINESGYSGDVDKLVKQFKDANTGFEQFELMKSKQATPFYQNLSSLMNKNGLMIDESLSPKSEGGMHYVASSPEQLRSRFAAFDPFRKTAATAAAMGVAAPDLLAQQQPVITQQQIDDELAKYGLLGR